MIKLANDHFTAEISPQHGAIITSLTWHAPSGATHELLHHPEGALPGTTSPNRFGLWPMVPFANRAFGGIVDNGDRRFQLPINDPAVNSAIHGFGWQAAWEVASATTGSATLRHRRQSSDDPYCYEAELTLSLSAEGVRLLLRVTSLTEPAVPYGIGFHPWFPCAKDTVLTVAAQRELVFGPQYRATGATQLGSGGPFARGRTVRQGHELAMSLIDWSGPAILATPSTGIRITIDASDSLRHPVLWMPPGADFVCFEPQSHAIGAPSEAAARACTPLKPLGNGETMSGWMTIVPQDI